MLVRFKKIHPNAKLPARAKPGDAGMDITCVDDGTLSDDCSQITYSLGLAMEIPEGYVGLLFPRSSICKTSLDLSNSVGVIDSGYRGEVKAVFNRRYHEDVVVWPPAAANADYRGDFRMDQVGVTDARYKAGDRVVQLIIIPIPPIETEWAEDLSETVRGAGGFGSSGK